MFPGLSFRETLSGRYWRLDAPTHVRAIALTLDARAPDLTDLVTSREFRVTGAIEAEGLATERPVEGTIAFRFFQQGRLHYRITFVGDDGRSYALGGQKEWSALAPVDSLTVLTASLHNGSGAEFAHATLSFDARTEGWAMVKSLRFGVRKPVL